MKYHVEPVSAEVKVPPHPTEGPMPPEGAHWLADQYTLRLILDGVIRRVEAVAENGAAPPPHDEGGRAPAITDEVRERLRAAGLGDDEIAHLTPAEANDWLAEHPTAPAPGEAQEH